MMRTPSEASTAADLDAAPPSAGRRVSGSLPGSRVADGSAWCRRPEGAYLGWLSMLI